MAHYKLTNTQVQNAVPAKGKDKVKLQDGGGLALVVRAKDRKFWTLRITVENKAREVGLGSASDPYDAVSLADARDRAFLINKAVREGVVLSEAVQRATGRKPGRITGPAAAPLPGERTFRDYAMAFILDHKGDWKSDVHQRQWQQSLEAHAFPVIGDLAPRAVTTAHVLQILRPIWNTYRETAMRLRGRIERILAVAKVEEGEPDRHNPAAWANHLKIILPGKDKLAVEHHPALPHAEVPALMAELVARADGPRGGGVAALALRFLILTASRTNEVLGARWSEVGLGGGSKPPREVGFDGVSKPRLWSIPKERMKMGKGHVVPLSDAALDVLVEADLLYRADDNAAIFPGVTYQEEGVSTLSNMAILMLLKRLAQPREKDGWALTKKVTAHGFRSSFRDWAADNGHDRELAEAALAHTVGGVEGAYRRSQMVERRAPMMAAWAAHCMSQDGGGKVVQMKRR